MAEIHKLKDIQCKNAPTPASGVSMLGDGGGLFLQVDNKGRKYWIYKYRFNKKQDCLRLGVYPDVSLKEARLRHAAARRLLADGTDPKRQQKEARQQEQGIMRFEAVAAKWHETRAAADRWSGLHAARQELVLRKHILPTLGKCELTDIEPLDVLHIVQELERCNMTDTPRRVLGIVHDVFTFARKMGWCESNPAADLSDELKTPAARHYRHITDPDRLRCLLLAIDQYDGGQAVRALLRISPLVFMRPSEIRLLRWCELDFDNKLIVKEKTKNGLPHIVPLSRQAWAILADLQPFSGHREYVFFNPTTKTAVSDGACASALKRMGFYAEFTPHGWRHTASTLLHEQGFETLHIEKQLAHKDKNEIRATYNAATYLEPRRAMMQRWADYLDGLRHAAPAD